MPRRKGLKWLAAALLAISAAPVLAAQPQPPAPARPSPARAPRPAIWLLADTDTKIYLFGTYHMLPRGFQWRSPLFDDIARRADELVVEVSQSDARENMASVLGALQLGKQAPVLWRVSPGRRQALREMIESLGVPIERFDGLQTWTVAMTLAVAQIERQFSNRTPPDGTGAAPADAGAAPEGTAPELEAGTQDEAPSALARQGLQGVETVLEAEFRASNRPISAVETAEQQLGFLASMPFALQRRMLEAMVDVYRKGAFDQEIDIGEDDWAAGNVAAVAAVAGRDMEGPLYEVLLPRRNAAWTDWLIARLERPGTLLFAVGAAHLAGPDSVQTMLAARGVTVRRIQ